MNKKIRSFASKIPEHLFYTALPQLISRVLHKNAQTTKIVALILRTVLAKYPRQSLWSCGWLRFSKSDKKKTAGEVSCPYTNCACNISWVELFMTDIHHFCFVGNLPWCTENFAANREEEDSQKCALSIEESFPILHLPG